MLSFDKPPAGIPSAKTSPTEWSQREIKSHPANDGWFVWLPEKLSPRQVLTILRSSLQGDLWQLWSLTALMMQSWPMLRKCSHELRSAVAKTKWAVKPYCEDGKEPTKRAQEKADLVSRAMRSFRPDPGITDERTFSGLVYDIMDSFLLGLSINEVQWYERNGERLPRATTWVHPRHFAFDPKDGRIMLFDGANKANRSSYVPLDPFKFISASFQSQSGSVLGMGMVRPIAWWWSAMVFNREWMLNFAQQYGTPFRTATYKPGMATEEISKLEAALSESGNSRYAVAPEGTQFEIDHPNSLGPDNAHRSIKEQADEQVQILFLGQTQSTEGKTGGLNNDESHMEVRRERIEELAQFVGQVLFQFASMVVKANYGTDDECPTVNPDFTEAMSQQEAATLVTSLNGTGIPLPAEEIYDLLNIKQPEEGDLVIKAGTLGVMSDPKETSVQPTLEERAEEQAAMSAASGGAKEDKEKNNRIKAMAT